MKKRNHNFLAELGHALYKEDPASPATNDPDPLGAAGDGTAEGDFIMNSDSTECMDCQVGYNERVAGGPGSSTTRPIHHEDMPERAILLMDLPKPQAGWTMRLVLGNDELSDKVDLVTENGVYDELYAELTKKFKPIHEEKGAYFTVLDTDVNKYVTIMSANQPDLVIRLSCNKKNTYDVFRVSFLVLSGK